MSTILLITHYVATLIMTGAIWLAQLSYYPLLALVGRENFIEYEREHIKRISKIAWTIIYIELFTGIALLFYAPRDISILTRITGFVLIALIWASTWLVQYPTHKKLSKGFDERLHAKLVRTNWARTALWTLRAALWTFAMWRLLGSSLA